MYLSTKVSDLRRRSRRAMRSTLGARSFGNLVVALALLTMLMTPVIGAAGSGDRVAPAGAIVVLSSGPADVTVSWTGSPDRKVVGYDVYWRESFVTHVRETRYTAAGLTCGTSYKVAVLAFDRAGNRSPATQAIVATAACRDTQPPVAPGNPTQVARTGTSMAVKWAPATDNTKVTAYKVFLNGGDRGTTADLGYELIGLGCGTSYTVGVEASDEAGNRSPRSSTPMSTAACHGVVSGDTQPPSAPSGLAVTEVEPTALTLGWNASTDNQAVTGYDVFVNGVEIRHNDGDEPKAV